MVGIPFFNGDGIEDINIGKVYVYTYTEAGWTLQTQLFGSGTRTAEFGSGVDLEGDTLIVGSLGERLNGIAPGTAWVFLRVGNSWQFQAKLLANDLAAHDFFGSRVRVVGDKAFITAVNDNSNGNQFQGSAYVFTRTGTTWTQTQKITASDGTEQNYFGCSLDFDGETAIIGAFYANDFTGTVYVFNQKRIQNNRNNFDFDGDGKADQSVFRSGIWHSRLSGAGGFSATPFGSPNDRITPADYDGDGKTDVAVFRRGIWYLQQSSDGFMGMAFGNADDVPVPADYDGDGKADIAVFRPGNGTWYLLQSSAGYSQSTFGISTDRPVPADYDGDGKTDIAVYRDGTWYLLRSANGFAAVQFGNATDKPVVGDYDGDGKADQAVYRNGNWYISGSLQGFRSAQFGAANDIPTTADYDGDGKNDVAVFRDGIWYILNSQQGFGAVQFGTTNDQPIPAAFLP